MASVLAFSTFCILLCGLLGGVTAATPGNKAPLHLTYYVHEIRGGPNATILAAAGPGNSTEIGWGKFIVVDNALKEGNTTDSKLLGSITGTAVVTTIGGVATGGFQLNTQHIFNAASQYNASSLTVIGTISTPTLSLYECIIPGGTGFFRGYTGYGILTPEVASAPPLYISQWDIYISYKM